MGLQWNCKYGDSITINTSDGPVVVLFGPVRRGRVDTFIEAPRVLAIDIASVPAPEQLGPKPVMLPPLRRRRR